MVCSVAPRIQTPGLFISTMASTRSPAPRKMASTGAGLGTGLPSRAMIWNLWPAKAMRRFSMAEALRRWRRTRWPGLTRRGSPAPRDLSLME